MIHMVPFRRRSEDDITIHEPREKGLFLKQNNQTKKCEIQVTDT
jgi:hypothetical protein